MFCCYIVGTFDQRLIQSFSRTSRFTEDFIILPTLLNKFEIKITTPHILTEVSNLLGRRRELHYSLEAYLTLVREVFNGSTHLVGKSEFVELGIADTAILDVAKDTYLICTDDGPLYGHLLNKKIPVINFNLLRAKLS